MELYLPIAELSINVFVLLGMGAAVGFLSGMFGVGGGFLLTPLLIFSGIPPAIAVASVSSQIVASSASGALSYFRRKAIDFKLGGYPPDVRHRGFGRRRRGSSRICARSASSISSSRSATSSSSAPSAP